MVVRSWEESPEFFFCEALDGSWMVVGVVIVVDVVLVLVLVLLLVDDVVVADEDDLVSCSISAARSSNATYNTRNHGMDEQVCTDCV